LFCLAQDIYKQEKYKRIFKIHHNNYAEGTENIGSAITTSKLEREL